MTLKFNNGPTTFSTSLMNAFKASSTSPFANTQGAILYIYDTATVPYPNVVPAASALATNALATFTISAVSTIIPVANGTAYLSSPLIATASLTGNIGWWAITCSTATANNTIISDSVSIYGGNAVATFSSMSTTAGSQIILTGFTLKFSHVA